MRIAVDCVFPGPCWVDGRVLLLLSIKAWWCSNLIGFDHKKASLEIRKRRNQHPRRIYYFFFLSENSTSALGDINSLLCHFWSACRLGLYTGDSTAPTTHTTCREDISTHTHPPYAQTYISLSYTHSSSSDVKVNNKKTAKRNKIRSKTPVKALFCITSNSLTSLTNQYTSWAWIKVIKSTTHK